MYIKDSDLRQIDAARLHTLRERDVDGLEDLAFRLSEDLSNEAKFTYSTSPL